MLCFPLCLHTTASRGKPVPRIAVQPPWTTGTCLLRGTQQVVEAGLQQVARSSAGAASWCWPVVWGQTVVEWLYECADKDVTMSKSG
jgi:hypothetical protein